MLNYKLFKRDRKDKVKTMKKIIIDFENRSTKVISIGDLEKELVNSKILVFEDPDFKPRSAKYGVLIEVSDGVTWLDPVSCIVWEPETFTDTKEAVLAAKRNYMIMGNINFYLLNDIKELNNIIKDIKGE